jgi:octanoyl-[GcvH]:protein N-octanoyltransferase
VTDAFGSPVRIVDDTALPEEQRPHPINYAEWVRQTLAGVRDGDVGILRLRRPKPTAAFSPQDTNHPRYDEARQQALANGFQPIKRGTGGRLSIFDEAALGVTLIAPHADPHAYLLERYDFFAGAIAGAMRELGVDARVGEVPNEYCPGKYSINAEGRIKLVGIAQRMNKYGYQMGAVVAVQRSEKACRAIVDAYETMHMPFDPATYGAVQDVVSGVSHQALADAIIKHLASCVTIVA